MSESMSRYSIVERLTKQKLEIMDQKNSLAKDIEECKQTIIEKKDELALYKKDAEADITRRMREIEKGITQLSQRFEFKKSRQKAMETHLDAKIAEIDKAMHSIEEISKTAPTPQEQS